MKGKRVIDFGADITASEVPAQSIAVAGGVLRDADDVLMEDVGGAWVGVGKGEAVGQAGGGEEAVVGGGTVSSLAVPLG